MLNKLDIALHTTSVYSSKHYNKINAQLSTPRQEH